MPSHRHCLIKRTDRLRELPLRRWRVPTPRAPIGSTTPRLPKESPRRAPEAQNISRKYGPRIQIHVRQRSEEHTSELQSPDHLVCRLLLEKKKNTST